MVVAAAVPPAVTLIVWSTGAGYRYDTASRFAPGLGEIPTAAV
jgi:hypothetical protein